MKKFAVIFKGERVFFIFVIIELILALAFLPFLPDKIAIHMDSNGMGDSFLPKYIGVFLAPVLHFVLFYLLFGITSGRPNVQRFYTGNNPLATKIILNVVFIMIQASVLLFGIGFQKLF